MNSLAGTCRLLSLRHAAVLVIAVLLGCASKNSVAQRLTTSPVSNVELPDAPDGAGLAAPSTPSDEDPQSNAKSSQHDSGSISGTVLDSSGALVPGAHITLTGKTGFQERSATSGSGGEFNFANLPPGTYHITVSSAGMGNYVSQDITLAPGERHEVTRIALNVATGRADVIVTVTQQELATEQVHAALDQRVLGIVPNFYSNYDPNPAPLSWKQKYQLALRSTTDPVSFLTAGIAAGFGQAIDLYSGYGQGAEGYAKRYGAAYADDIIDRVLGSAVLPSIFHQDPRYFYKGTGTKKERTLYAIKSVFVCKGDNGEWQPNYSHLIGNFAAAGISNLYYPASDRGAWLTIRNGLIDTAGNAGANLLREFILKGLTPKANKNKKDTP